MLDLFDFEYLGEYLNFLFLGLLKIFIKLTYFLNKITKNDFKYNLKIPKVILIFDKLWKEK